MREVTRLLGYTVAVSSTVGHGTCVNVRFPSHRLIAETPPRPREVSEVLNATTPRACRLLLLEDNDSVREATELFLSLEGFEVHSAANVSQAETLLADLRPGDIFIADYHLQGNLTGLDVLLQLRVQQRSDVPGILMSGDLQSMLRVVKTAIPRCRFLSKPVDTKLLLSAIAELGTS